MDIQSIGNGSFAIYISGAELDRLDLTPENVTPDIAKGFIIPALGGDAYKGHLLIELFTGRSDVLMFVREDCGEPVCCIFSSLEELIYAVTFLPHGTPSELYDYDGKYVLITFTVCPVPLSEFGTTLAEICGLPEHVREHGRPLITSNAADVLKSYFALRS